MWGAPTARRPRSGRLIGGLLALAVLAAASPAGAAPAKIEVIAAAEAPLPDGTTSPVLAAKRSRGYLVPDAAAHDDAKSEAAARAPAPVREPEPDSLEAALAPSTSFATESVFDSNSAPSDTTGAVGTSRYVHLINRKFAILSKTRVRPLSTGTLNDLAGFTGNAFDPQVMWDQQQRRFFYAMDVIVDANNHLLAFGFSTGRAPTDAGDFCKYALNYGTRFPDYPKLGDTRDFLLIGSNVFDPNAYLRSDVASVTKPPAGTLSACPDPATFGVGIKQGLSGPGAAGEFTPVPANQVDSNPVGWVVTRRTTMPATALGLHRVTRDPATGAAVIQDPGTSIPVPSYETPPDAPQKSPSTRKLDTLDARPTNAVSSINPQRVNGAGVEQLSLWTQHTVPGGAGAMVRWYEIRPSTSSLWDSGTISGSRHVFNGAISSDRAVNGATKVFGQNMAVGFSTSSTSSDPAIRMVSKPFGAPQSPQIAVKGSPGSYIGFDCAGTDVDCRWGDYSAASPDPAPPAGESRIWFTNQFASGGTSTTVTNWRTWIWAAKP